MKRGLKICIVWCVVLLVSLSLLMTAFYMFTEPRQDRNWAVEHSVLAKVDILGDEDDPTVSIKNVRDYKWTSVNKVNYQDMRFQLDKIVGLKAVISHFSVISEVAHVFLIFVLDDGRELGVSVEARREEGERFSIEGGLFSQFELIYVLATPDDLLGIRKLNHESTYLYPIKATKEKVRELFMLIVAEVNRLNENPEMYHLLFKNCTNQLVKHVSILTEQKYPWYFQTLAPGNTAKILYDLGLIDIPNASFEEIQAKSLIP